SRYGKNDIVFTEEWKNIGSEFSKSHAHSGNRSRLYDGKQTPSIKKSHEFPISFTQINVLSARFGKHGRKLAVAQSCNQGDETRQRPNENQPSGTSDISYNI